MILQVHSYSKDEIGTLNPREGSGFLGSEGWFDARTADFVSKSFLGKRRNISEITKLSFHDKSWGAHGIILVDYFELSRIHGGEFSLDRG